jgi:hypothetical protein
MVERIFAAIEAGRFQLSRSDVKLCDSVIAD